MDRGVEHHRLRTNARTSTLVPLLTVLIAALPVPARADFFASLTAAVSLASSRWVSEISAATKSEVRMKCLACLLQFDTLHCKILITPSEISSFRFLQCVCVPPWPCDDRRGCSFLCHPSPENSSAAARNQYHRSAHHHETEQMIAIWIWLSVRNTDCRFRSDKQGPATHVSVDAMDVLTDRRTVRITFLLKVFVEHSSACCN